jgi:hypothetical protein
VKPYPKPHREESKTLLKAIMDEHGYCLVGSNGKYGSCYGEECLHHIHGRGAGGENVKGNLIRVCLHHHQMIHNGLIKKQILYEYIERLAQD